ncbi:Metallo-dependent hydrolase [Lentinus tigrinus ALCF2SS1-6]|uniref:Metallo-dependent hydrolase n=1 Tax=Lentinus tigrinus ALCF2SS1-6 TaxID=1328759 RepID=A0A5C2S4J6_9APHY|nr:Metallo-dependent hydrolase [Lentinus tigrinus ALCF2SS1-6]
MSQEITGYCAEALKSLTPSQVEFLQKLPKAELHAHLNGSIPLHLLQELANEYYQASSNDRTATVLPEVVRSGIQTLQDGIQLSDCHEFFALFPAIYALTSNPPALRRAARAVLEHFLSDSDGHPQAAYLELRSTPRETAAMTRRQYVETVLDEVEQYPPERAALIVSLDRRMDAGAAAECIECAISLRNAGRRIVGVDLCGEIKAGNMADFEQHFRRAKEAGLKVTLHIAEVAESPEDETLLLLSFKPDRLGHATYLNEAAKKIVHTYEIPIELCLSSNLITKTVPTLDAHHIRYYLGHNHPIAICTDDILPFRNSLLGEYALLMAQPPLGLGLTEAEIEKVAKMGMECRFL